jgi:hypothetical protein
MAEALYLCEKEHANAPTIGGVRALILNSDDAALVAATSVITFTDVGNEGDTLVIDGVTYTMRATPAAAYDIDIGADAATSAANLVAAITGAAGEGTAYGTGTDAHPTVSAAAASAVVTISARDQGPSGNGIVLKATSTEISVAVNRLTGGNSATKATATITLADVMTANEIVKIGTRTYTFVAVPTAAGHVDIGSTAAASAANLSAAINAGAGAGTAYGTGTTAHPDVTATVTGATVTVTHRRFGSDTEAFDEKGALNPLAPVQLSKTGDVTFGSSDGTGLTIGGTYGDLGVEAAAACNRALGTTLFDELYFDKFTAIHDLTSGPIAADQQGYVITSTGVVFVSAPA